MNVTKKLQDLTLSVTLTSETIVVSFLSPFATKHTRIMKEAQNTQVIRFVYADILTKHIIHKTKNLMYLFEKFLILIKIYITVPVEFPSSLILS